MKKRMKFFMALVLAATTVLCSVPVFAAEENETVRWYYSENYIEYSYAGELKEGKNSVGACDDDIIYCNFIAEKAGYYLFINENSYVDEDVFTAIENGRVKSVREDGEWMGFLGAYGGSGSFYYLEPGEVYIGFYLVGGTGFPVSPDFGEITVTYCGEVTDITFEESAFDVLPVDLWWQEYYYQDNFDGAESGYRFPYGLSIKNTCVTFSTGKTVEMGNKRYTVVTEAVITDESYGSYDAEIRFLDYKEEIQLNLHRTSDYIENAELCNAEKYATVKKYYNGDIEYDNSIAMGETIVLTFADGTKKNVVIPEYENAEVTLPNGRTYCIYVYFGYLTGAGDESDICLFISLALSQYRLNSYDCFVAEADIGENYTHFCEITIGDYVDLMVYHLESAKNARSATEFIVGINNFCNVFRECIAERSDVIFTELVKFIGALI